MLGKISQCKRTNVLWFRSHKVLRGDRSYRKQHGGCHGWERGTEGTVWWVEGLSWEDEKALEREAWGCSHKWERATNAASKRLNWRRLRYVYFTIIKNSPTPTHRGGRPCWLLPDPQRTKQARGRRAEGGHGSRESMWSLRKPGVEQGRRRKKTTQERWAKSPVPPAAPVLLQSITAVRIDV